MLWRPRGCFGRSAWALVLLALLSALRSSRSGAPRGRRGAAPVISPAETKGLRGAGARLGLTKLRSVVSYVKTASHGCLLCLLFLRLCRLRLSAMRTLS